GRAPTRARSADPVRGRRRVARGSRRIRSAPVRARSRRPERRELIRPPGPHRPVPPLRLDTSVKFLKGIGEKRAELLAKLSIHTAHDLLWHLPHRYLDLSTITPIARLEVGRDLAAVGRVIAKGILPTRPALP